METKTDKHNTADITRKSNAMDYILLAIGCSLVIYGAIDWHFFTKQQRAELDASFAELEASRNALIETCEKSTEELRKMSDDLEALNADNQTSAAEEK